MGYIMERQSMSNSKAFERILKYNDMEVQYPGILDLTILY
jgi:hypothetical protein